ncbi:hypothetical protein NEOLEDRAFT_829633 [Neolentinus lepideus HHB14362 ss-1]|uniref:FAD-binding domain-containing protein n=1 Tax=Neolentinus lepideus HHB14362 ss-1 TaxID=1314782 RepID=A0A165P938_9AGAM|nr:hypothetical protein NEOLEDRAFT_829633 [Neolentinus lepideus HHB14362 ss-1]
MIPVSPEPRPILIVGAGPTGLVAALTLRQNGIPVRIIDKEPKPHFGSRGSGIMPRTLELPGGTEVMKEFVTSPRSYSTPGIPFFNNYVLGQDVAQGILRSHLEKYNCQVEFGTELQDFEQQPDHVVVHLIKHAEGNDTPETLSVSYVIGADGARGVVRKMLGLAFLGETRPGDAAIIADARLTGLSREHWHIWGEIGTQGFSAIPRWTHDDDVFWVSVFGKDIPYDKLMANPESINDIVKEITDRADIEIKEFLTLSTFKFNIRMVTEFGRGRVFVAGDAAHVHSPTGGQGMNSSVMDAFNLAWKLALAHNGLASPALLQSYTDERIPVIRNMLEITTDTLDRTLDNEENAWERGRKFFQLDVNYRGSPIVVDQRQGAVVDAPPPNVYTFGSLGRVQAGDRAPDAPGLLNLKDASSPVTSLFNIFTPTRHTVLIFSASPPIVDAVIDALRIYPAGLVQTVAVLPTRVAVRESLMLPKVDVLVKDGDRHAYEGYSVDPWKDELAVIIVRPDGVVGGIGSGVHILKDYFHRIFN